MFTRTALGVTETVDNGQRSGYSLAAEYTYGAGTGSDWGGWIGGIVGTAVGVGLTAACPATAGLGCVGAGGLTTSAGAATGALKGLPKAPGSWTKFI
ncbi:hypothetical protein [Saccharothrix syringae]|uniref:Uncharacterized protein n=1 Tax=Saccharothrix syringae TaxID=103733 RepID=A0A5Q0GYF4_SACSY|nr:hypothetical protein [Saccharothrix syringae]QFZ18989.1 hypothetical protein EKG83_17400 [Saccharothrix syringae]